MKESALPELPGGWMWTKLGDIIIKISNGISERQINEKSNIMVTRIETISNGFINLNKVGYLKDLSPQEIEKYTLLQGDILFSNINSDLHLGKTAIFSFDSITLLHGMNLLLIRSNKECINPKLLHYLCNYYRFSGTFISIAQHAVNQSSINQSKLNNLPIPLPPLSEQRRIVMKIEELFTRLDSGVLELKKTQAQLKRYRHSVLKTACEGKLVPNEAELAKVEGRDYEPADVLLARILKERRENWNGKGKYKEPATPDISGLKELPNDWHWASIEQIGELISGQHILEKDYNYDSVGLPYLTGPADFGLIHPIVSRWTEKPKTIANKNDVLITVKGAGVGKANILDIDKAAISRQLMAIRVKNIDNHYIFFVILSKFNFFQKLGAGSTVPGIDRDGILNTFVPLPPLTEQCRIVAEVERRLSITDEVEKTVGQSIAQAKRLRQSILKKAFEGRLVAQDASDEPARKLLERIRIERNKNGLDKGRKNQ